MTVTYSKIAKRELKKLKNNKDLQAKTIKILESLEAKAFKFSKNNKPLQASYKGLTGCWSYRIDKKNRIVYTESKDGIYVISLTSHYQDH